MPRYVMPLRGRPARPVALVALVLAACRAGGDAPPATPRTAADSQAAHVAEVAAAGGVVDSILPIPEALARFRATIPERPDTLRHAAPSRDALVASWAAAIAASDTAALTALLVDRAEFAWLYYPTSRMSQPPYEAPPGLLWGQLLASSNEGAGQLLRRHGGARFQVLGLQCPAAPVVEGDNRLHERCTVRVRTPQGALPATRLFGTILERGGRFKFLGYANAL